MPMGRTQDRLGVVALPVVNDLVVSGTAEAVALQELVAPERFELLHRGEHRVATGEVGKRHGANLPNVRVTAQLAPIKNAPFRYQTEFLTRGLCALRFARAVDRMLGSPYNADDALQETLLRAWRGLAGFEPGRPLRPWLDGSRPTSASTRSRNARSGCCRSTTGPPAGEGEAPGSRWCT